MKIQKIYKELEDFLSSDHPLRHRDIEIWTLKDWQVLSEITQELVRQEQQKRIS